MLLEAQPLASARSTGARWPASDTVSELQSPNPDRPERDRDPHPDRKRDEAPDTPPTEPPPVPVQDPPTEPGPAGPIVVQGNGAAA